MLNNIFIILIALIFSFTTSYSNEPVDIWNLEKKENNDRIELNENQNSQNENKIKKKNNNQNNINENLVVLGELKSENKLVVGIYDPIENGLNINMWSGSDGKKVYQIKKKLNNMELSQDAKNIYTKILLTNTYPPEKGFKVKDFFDIKSEWLIKNGDLNLIENYIIKNINIIPNEKLIRFAVDQLLSEGKIDKSCKILKETNLEFKENYLKNFLIFCQIHKKNFEAASMMFDLEKEKGYNDIFFQKKFQKLTGLISEDKTISDKNLLNLHLTYATVPNYKFKPNDKTSNLFWKYLTSNNLLVQSAEIDLKNEENIILLEKATHNKNYKEKELLNLYKRFQFSIDQLLNIEREIEKLSDVQARALIYQGILLSNDPIKSVKLCKILKKKFLDSGFQNAFEDELRLILNKYDLKELPSDLTDFYILNTAIDENKKIKFNNKILHQSKITNYFIKDNFPKKKAQKDINNFLKKVKKSKNNYLLTKDIIVIESLEYDGIEIKEEYKDLYKVQENNLPIDIQVLINDKEFGLALLRIVEIIGQDELSNLGSETLYFIINALNQMNIDPIRNSILSKVLPQKV